MNFSKVYDLTYSFKQVFNFYSSQDNEKVEPAVAQSPETSSDVGQRSVAETPPGRGKRQPDPVDAGSEKGVRRR